MRQIDWKILVPTDILLKNSNRTKAIRKQKQQQQKKKKPKKPNINNHYILFFAYKKVKMIIRGPILIKSHEKINNLKKGPFSPRCFFFQP